MRTLTTPATLVTGRAYAAPVLLVTLTTTSGTVFRLSDYSRVIGGVEYLGLIQNPDDLTEALNDFDGGGTPATAHLVLFNNRPVGGKSRFSDLILTPRNTSGTYDFRNARVDIDRLEDGQALADAVRLQSFYLEAPSEIGEALITLQMSDLAQKIEDGLPITKVSTALFPYAQADAIDKEIRRPFGTLKNVKAIPIVDGAVTALTSDITDTDTTVALDDVSLLPNAGTGLIESEFVTWNGKSATTLLNVVRGTSSSTADAHTAGTDFMHVRTDEYVYAVGEGMLVHEAGDELIPNGAFDADLSGWTQTGATNATWVSSNGGEAELTHPGGGAAQLEKTVAVSSGIACAFSVTVRGAFTPSITLTSNAVTLASVSQGSSPGTYNFEVTPTGATATVQATAHALGTGTFDSVSLIPQSKTFSIKSITNVRVNGHVARTTPTATVSDETRVANRIFGTIKFTPSSLVKFHTLPLGQPETFTPAAISVTGDGATNVAGTRVITPTTGAAEVGKRTRRTISGEIATTTAFIQTNFWHLGRYLTSKGIGSIVVFDQGQGQAGNTAGDTWSFNHTIEYDSDGSETIVFTSLLGSAKVITLTFAEAYLTYVDESGAGTSAAARVIGDVVCDVEGVEDDGTFTGTPGTLLENPTDITGSILRGLYGLSGLDLDSSWATTRAIMASAAYKWAALLGSRQFSDLRRLLSEQARARLVLSSGKVGLRFRSYRPAADVTFQYDPDGGRTGLAQALSVKLTSPTEMIGGLTVRYAFDDQRGEYQKSMIFGDAVAASALPPMDLAFVSDDHTARDVGAYWYGLKSRQRFRVDGTAWHNALALEQGDHFAISGHPAMEAHGDEALIFGLLRKADKGGRDGIGRIAIGGLEDTIEGDVGPEDTSMAWGSRGLLAKNNAATPNTKIDVTAAAVVLRNSSNLIVIRHNPGSLTVDLGAAGPVANGRDQAGAHTASSFIHIYWIWDATNGVLALTSSQTAPPTGPAFPTNFTYWGYVGAVYFTAGSALVRTTIAGAWAQRQNVEALAAAVTDNTEHSIDGTAIWPANAMRIGGSWGAILSVAGDSADLRAETGVDSGPHLETPGATTTGFGGGFTMNVTGQTIWYIQSANASRVWRVEIDKYELPNGGA